MAKAMSIGDALRFAEIGEKVVEIIKESGALRKGRGNGRRKRKVREPRVQAQPVGPAKPMVGGAASRRKTTKKEKPRPRSRHPLMQVPAPHDGAEGLPPK